MALSLAKSNNNVIPLYPNLLYEKYRLTMVGTKPNINPDIKVNINIFLDLNKLKIRKGESPISGAKTI